MEGTVISLWALAGGALLGAVIVFVLVALYHLSGWTLCALGVHSYPEGGCWWHLDGQGHEPCARCDRRCQCGKVRQ